MAPARDIPSAGLSYSPPFGLVVETIARVGDIDHLVATPRGLWVVETRHGRVASPDFPETLRRIALNVEAVRD